MTTLQQRMIEAMTVRGLVPSTQRVYLRAVRDLAVYYKRSPDPLSTREIQRYLLMLHEERGLTYSTCNTIVHGLRFFYGTTLGRSAMHLTIPLAKEPSMQCPRTFYTDLDTLICKIQKMPCSGWSMPGI